MSKTSTRSILATSALAALTLTSCAAPGWEGTGVITELEYMEAERERDDNVDYDSLEITVLDRSGTERSVDVADCPEGKPVLGQVLTQAEVEDLCGPIGWSQDD